MDTFGSKDHVIQSLLAFTVLGIFLGFHLMELVSSNSTLHKRCDYSFFSGCLFVLGGNSSFTDSYILMCLPLDRERGSYHVKRAL